MLGFIKHSKYKGRTIESQECCKTGKWLAKTTDENGGFYYTPDSDDIKNRKQAIKIIKNQIDNEISYGRPCVYCLELTKREVKGRFGPMRACLTCTEKYSQE